MENHDKTDIFGKGFNFIGVISTGTDIWIWWSSHPTGTLMLCILWKSIFESLWSDLFWNINQMRSLEWIISFFSYSDIDGDVYLLKVSFWKFFWSDLSKYQLIELSEMNDLIPQARGYWWGRLGELQRVGHNDDINLTDVVIISKLSCTKKRRQKIIPKKSCWGTGSIYLPVFLSLLKDPSFILDILCYTIISILI